MNDKSETNDSFPHVIFADDLEVVSCHPINKSGAGCIMTLAAPCHPEAHLVVSLNQAAQSVEIVCSECDLMIACVAIARRR